MGILIGNSNTSLRFVVIATLIIVFQTKICNVQAISCYVFGYTYGSVPEDGSFPPNFAPVNSSVVTGCSECRKFVSLYNNTGLVSITERWQCETSVKAAKCPDQETVGVTYYLDGSSETHLCTCCHDLCNGRKKFCRHDDKMIRRIKAMITPKTQPSSVVPLAITGSKGHNLMNGEISLKTSGSNRVCYTAGFTHGSLFNAERANNVTDDWFFYKEAKSMRNCRECQKTAFTTYQSGKLRYDKQNWECISGLAGGSRSHQNKKQCSPFVSATVSRDGFSIWRAVCSCCQDRCNDERFCKLEGLSNNNSNKKHLDKQQQGTTTTESGTAATKEEMSATEFQVLLNLPDIEQEEPDLLNSASSSLKMTPLSTLLICMIYSKIILMMK